MKKDLRMKQPIHAPLLATAICLLTIGFSHAESPNAEQVIATMEGINGITPGARRNHIRGICASGRFVGSKALQSYTRSALFSGQSLPVLARFSLAGGNPNAPDTARSPRGLAIELQLPQGQAHHFTFLNLPVFSASNPQTFLDALLANAPDPQTGKPDAAKVQAFRESHPDAKPAAEFMAKNNPPASYANSNYFGIHTFQFINRDGKTTLVRLRFEPQGGVRRLSDEELKTAPPRFLDEDLLSKVRSGPLQWKLIVTLGEPGDEQANPTVYWPADRKEIEAGVLNLTTAQPQAGAPCEGINFDPLVLSDGVAPTDDPVLLFRSGAYASSYGRRITGR